MKILKKLLSFKSNKNTQGNNALDLSTLPDEDKDFDVKRLELLDVIGLNGHHIPRHPKDRGYQCDRGGSEYCFRSFILDFGDTNLITGALDSLYRAGALNVTFYHTKLTKSQAIKKYKQASTDEGARLIQMRRSGNDIEAREAEKSMDNAHRLLEEISDGYNDGLLGTLVLTIFAPDEKTLDQIGMLIQDDLIGNDHNLRTLYNRQRDGWLSSLPIGNNRLTDSVDRRFFDRTAIVAASPFYSSRIPFSGGVPLGVNQHTFTMEFLNVFAPYLDNYSSLIVGASGSGKSFANKYISSCQRLLGQKIFSIDPDGEMGPICVLMGGAEVEVREGGDVCLNVCAMTEEEIDVTLKDGRRITKVVVPIGTKQGQLIKFYDKLMGKSEGLDGLLAEEKAILKQAISDVITKKGITEDPESLYEKEKTPVRLPNGEIQYKRVRKPEFTLTDIYMQILINCTSDYNLDTLTFGEITDSDAKRLLKVLRGYLRDKPDGKLFDGQTSFGKDRNVDDIFDSIPWVNFNIKSVEGSDIYELVMHTIMMLGWEYFIKRPSLRRYRKRIKAEEGWRLKRVPGGMQFVEELARRSRKYNGGIDIITQDLAPFLDDEDGVAVVKNATSGLFLRIGSISKEEKEKLKSIFNFSEGELEIICRRPPESEEDESRGEGILRVGGSSAFIKVTVSDEIRKFIDTDPEYLARNGLYPEREAG
ncbi:VirB4 family type IV secretion system protein [Paenibacillus sp. GYB003]|uniref:VirB4 family type IV secretion system protein n=1 Tax=Paenibacillus sp. GYB003 TaxID=2994392 RepID=UPI002F9675BF